MIFLPFFNYCQESRRKRRFNRLRVSSTFSFERIKIILTRRKQVLLNAYIITELSLLLVLFARVTSIYCSVVYYYTICVNHLATSCHDIFSECWCGVREMCMSIMIPAVTAGAVLSGIIFSFFACSNWYLMPMYSFSSESLNLKLASDSIHASTPTFICFILCDESASHVKNKQTKTTQCLDFIPFDAKNCFGDCLQSKA